jgi:hypothetical protein
MNKEHSTEEPGFVIKKEQRMMILEGCGRCANLSSKLQPGG